MEKSGTWKNFRVSVIVEGSLIVGVRLKQISGFPLQGGGLCLTFSYLHYGPPNPQLLEWRKSKSDPLKSFLLTHQHRI